MNKVAFIVVCLAILGIGIYSYLSPERKKVEEQKDFSSWKEFIPRSRLFQVSLPSHPQYARDLIPIPNSDKKRRYDMYASEKIDGTLFLISVMTYPKEFDLSSHDILRQNIDELIHNKIDNHLTKMSISVLQGLHSIDFTIENREFYVEGKAIQDGHTIYLLTYIAREENFDPDEYQHFIQSFHFLNKKEKANP